MTYNIPVKEELLNKAVVKTLSCFLNLSVFEINVISAMLDNNIESLTYETRRTLRDYLSTDVFTLNNYVKKLKDKGILVYKDKNLFLNDNIKNAASSKNITFSFHVR